MEIHYHPLYAGILLYPSFPPLGRLTSLSVAGDLALCGCLLELDSREKVKDCRVGMTNNISKCLVERFAVVIGTVEVRLYSISLVPGFRWEAGSPSTQSNDPCLLVVAKKRVHIQGLRNVINNGVEGVRNIIGGDHSQHHESSNQGMEEGALLVACGGICGDSFIVRFVAKLVDIP